MKNFVSNLLKNKVFRIFAVIGIFLIIIMIAFILRGINKSVKYMQAGGSTNESAPYPTYPTVNTTGKSVDQMKQIQRGEYLVKAGDCMACHTDSANKGKQFAGGLEMATPFGNLYTPNITPDKKTGIGTWTLDQFDKAMRQGINPHGEYYFPAFPYPYFAKFSTEQIADIKAYLDNIPAVEKPNLKNKMIFPFNIRFLQLGWRILFFTKEHQKPYVYDDKKDSVWNRGAFLVDGPGHCAMCHTPSYYIITPLLTLGAPIEKYDLAGAKVQGYLAPNITSSNIGQVTIQEIVDVFKKDALIGGGKVEGPMLEVNHDSLQYLNDDDLTAIATYLKTVESETPPVKSSGTPGAGVYETYCSGCHATGSGGAPKFGDKAAWEALLKKEGGQENLYNNAIKGINSMPAKGTCLSCSDDQIKEAVNYMISGEGETTSIPPVTTVVPLSMQDGKKVYESYCSSCHTAGLNGAPKLGDKAAFAPVIQKGFVEAYVNTINGYKGHPARGNCPTCSDAEIKAALKYMLQQAAPEGTDYSLW